MKVDAVANLIKRYPSLPLVAYVGLHAPQFKAVAQLGRLGLTEVVLQHFDDEPEAFKERVERLEGSELSHALVSVLKTRLARVPRQLAVTLENVFEQPHRYSSAFDIAMDAHVAIVKVYRDMDAAGLGSPKKLLIAAKVARGFGYLRDPGYSVLDVSIKLGYKSARIFSHHWGDVFGKNPAGIRNRLSDEDAIERVLEWLRSGDGESLEDDRGHPNGPNGSRRRRRRREPN